MLKDTKIIYTVFVLAVLTVLALVPMHQSSKAAQTQELRVVKIHADWCGACNITQPWVDALKQDYKGDSRVGFVTFDVTNKQTKTAAQALAVQENLQSLFDRYQKRTGLILLVNASGEIVNGINYSHGEKRLKAAVAKEL